MGWKPVLSWRECISKTVAWYRHYYFDRDFDGHAFTVEQIEAYVLYVPRGTEEAEIVSLRSFIDDGGARLKQLLSQLRARVMETFRFPKVHPAEVSKEGLKTLGFSPAGGHRLYAARARSA